MHRFDAFVIFVCFLFDIVLVKKISIEFIFLLKTLLLLRVIVTMEAYINVLFSKGLINIDLRCWFLQRLLCCLQLFVFAAFCWFVLVFFSVLRLFSLCSIFMPLLAWKCFGGKFIVITLISVLSTITI